MKYTLFFVENEAEVAKRNTGDEQEQAYWAGWGGYIGSMREAGVMVSGQGLEPASTATTLRMGNGTRSLQDGPFADTREQLGGFAIIEAENLDRALDWAEKAPCAKSGCVEIRPCMPDMA